MVKKLCRWALEPFTVYVLFFILLLLLTGGNELDSIKAILSFALNSGIAFIITIAWVRAWVFVKKFE